MTRILNIFPGNLPIAFVCMSYVILDLITVIVLYNMCKVNSTNYEAPRYILVLLSYLPLPLS
jgi:hypothetical protein